MDADNDRKDFPTWCEVCFPDGSNVWGRVGPADWPGGAMLYVDVPDDHGGIARRQFHATASIARLVPATEREAREVMTERRNEWKQMADEERAGHNLAISFGD